MSQVRAAPLHRQLVEPNTLRSLIFMSSLYIGSKDKSVDVLSMATQIDPISRVLA